MRERVGRNVSSEAGLRQKGRGAAARARPHAAGGRGERARRRRRRCTLTPASARCTSSSPSIGEGASLAGARLSMVCTHTDQPVMRMKRLAPHSAAYTSSLGKTRTGPRGDRRGRGVSGGGGAARGRAAARGAGLLQPRHETDSFAGLARQLRPLMGLRPLGLTSRRTRCRAARRPGGPGGERRGSGAALSRGAVGPRQGRLKGPGAAVPPGARCPASAPPPQAHVGHGAGRLVGVVVLRRTRG
jgi:hypothetical protein